MLERVCTKNGSDWLGDGGDVGEEEEGVGYRRSSSGLELGKNKNKIGGWRGEMKMEGRGLGGEWG